MRVASRFQEEEPAGMPPMEFPPEALDKRPVVKKPNGEHPPADLPIPTGESALSLTQRDIPEPVKLCDPWAVEGVNIIAGRPKLGKTTLERQKLAAASTGTEFLDSKFPVPVKCAFLSLEEGELLCRLKFKKAGFNDDALSGIQLFFEWPRGDLGVKLLDRYLTENPDVRLVCIDSLTRFRVIPDVRVPAFMADYEAIQQLHDMAKKHPGIAIDVIHHTRKAKSDDPIDDVSGTYGLTAACDSVTVLRHHADGVVMYTTGRMWTREESQYSLRRSGKQTWEMIGVHLDLTAAQKEAYEIVKAEPAGISGKELSDKLGITPQSAWQRLDELLEKGFVRKAHHRVYAK
jgi:RecA-family ATPase